MFWKATRLLFLFLAWAAAVFAQAAVAPDSSIASEDRKDERFWRKISFDVSGGPYTLPDLLLGIELEKHPRRLAGSMFSVSGSYRLGKKNDWFLYSEFNRVAAVGKGNWAEDGMRARLAEIGVAGNAVGRLVFAMREVVVGVERCFFSDRRFQICPKTGGGVGWLKTKFRGEFVGFLEREGVSFPLREPAWDLSRRTIPILSTHLNFRWSIDKERRTTLSCGPYWNTGHGFVCGFGFRPHRKSI